MSITVSMVDEDEDELVAFLTKAAQSADRFIAEQARAELLKVGPKGYVHGWIFVGVPGVGARIHHPEHGPGVVTRHNKKTMGARFDKGHEAAFEHAPETPDPDEHFVPRAPSGRKPRIPAAAKPEPEAPSAPPESAGPAPILDRQIVEAEARVKTTRERLARAQAAFDAAGRDPRADALAEHFPLGTGGSGGGRRGSTDAQLRRYVEARKARDAAQSQHVRAEAKLKELTARRGAAGKYSRDTVKAGDAIKVKGSWERVQKANPKTVQIDAGRGMEVKYRWDQVTDHRPVKAAPSAAAPPPTPVDRRAQLENQYTVERSGRSWNLDQVGDDGQRHNLGSYRNSEAAERDRQNAITARLDLEQRDTDRQQLAELGLEEVGFRDLRTGDRFTTHPDQPIKHITQIRHLGSADAQAAMVYHEDHPYEHGDSFTLLTGGRPVLRATASGPAGEMAEIRRRVDAQMTVIGNKPTSTIHNDLAQTLERRADDDVARARKRAFPRGGTGRAWAAPRGAQEDLEQAYADQKRRRAEAAEHRRRAAELLPAEQEERRKAKEAWDRAHPPTPKPTAPAGPVRPTMLESARHRDFGTLGDTKDNLLTQLETGQRDRSSTIAALEGIAQGLRESARRRSAKDRKIGTPAEKTKAADAYDRLADDLKRRVLQVDQATQPEPARAPAPAPPASTNRSVLPFRPTNTPAKRGDLVIVEETTSHHVTGEGGGYRQGTQFTLARVTSISKDGKIKALEDLRHGGGPYKIPERDPRRRTMHTIPAAAVNVDAALAAGRDNPWSHDPTKTGMPFRSMDEVTAALAPHLQDRTTAAGIIGGRPLKDIPGNQLQAALSAAADNPELRTRIVAELARRAGVARDKPRPPALPGVTPARARRAAPRPYQAPQNLEPGAEVFWSHTAADGTSMERTGRVWDTGPLIGGRDAVWVIPDFPMPGDQYSAILVSNSAGPRGRGQRDYLDRLRSSDDPTSPTGSATRAAARVAERHRTTGKAFTVRLLNKALIKASRRGTLPALLTKAA